MYGLVYGCTQIAIYGRPLVILQWQRKIKSFTVISKRNILINNCVFNTIFGSNTLFMTLKFIYICNTLFCYVIHRKTRDHQGRTRAVKKNRIKHSPSVRGVIILKTLFSYELMQIFSKLLLIFTKSSQFIQSCFLKCSTSRSRCSSFCLHVFCCNIFHLR